MLHLNKNQKRFSAKTSLPQSPQPPVQVCRSQLSSLDKAAAQETLLDKQALKDIIDGAALLGTGGGGPKNMALKILDTLEDNQHIPMANLANVGDNDWVVVSAFLGSPDAVAALKNPTFQSPTRAVRLLEKSSGHTAQFIVPVEIGAVNSIIPIAVALDLGLPVVDTDGAARAVPTLSCLTFATDDSLLSTGVTVTNETNIVKNQQSAFFEVNNPGDAESLAGAVIKTSAFGNLGGLALWMMQGKQLKALSIAGGLSHSLALGRALRQAPVGSNYPELVVETLKQYNIRSRVIAQSLTTVAFESATEDALDHGKLTLKNDDGIFTIYIVNENMFAYHSSQSQPFIMSPDMLCYILEDGTTLDNCELQTLVEQGKQQTLSLIGIEAADQLKNKEEIVQVFLGIFNQVGYAGAYIPFEA